MKITITGSLGNIGRPLTKKLVAAGHQVTVVSHAQERKAEIESLGARAAIGSVGDAAFLTQAFMGAEAVFAMTPPAYGGSNIVANTINAGKAYATAIQAAHVPRVVMLSSIGAHVPDKNGPIKAIYNIEQLYNDIEGTDFVFLRAGYFFTNFLNDIPMVKTAGIIGANFPATLPMVLVHYEDIATTVAALLETSFTGKNVRYIASDIRTPGEIAKALGASIDKPELPWIEFTDEQALQGMQQAGLSSELAELFVEMGAGFRSDRLFEHFKQVGSPVDGRVKLEDFAKEFAKKFTPAPVG